MTSLVRSSTCLSVGAVRLITSINIGHTSLLRTYRTRGRGGRPNDEVLLLLLSRTYPPNSRRQQPFVTIVSAPYVHTRDASFNRDNDFRTKVRGDRVPPTWNKSTVAAGSGIGFRDKCVYVAELTFFVAYISFYNYISIWNFTRHVYSNWFSLFTLCPVERTFFSLALFLLGTHFYQSQSYIAFLFPFFNIVPGYRVINYFSRWLMVGVINFDHEYQFDAENDVKFARHQSCTIPRIYLNSVRRKSRAVTALA